MTKSNMPSCFLLAVEDAELARPALDFIAQLSQATSISLELVHVWEPVPFMPADASFTMDAESRSYRQLASEHASNQLDGATEYAKGLGLEVRARHIREGVPVASILEVAEDRAVDCIVTCSHQRHGVSRWFEGSVSEKLTRLAKCPVLTVPERT